MRRMMRRPSGKSLFAAANGSLQFDRALHGVVRTAKLYEHTVAGRLEDATVMAGDEGLQYFLPPCPESSQRAGVVVTHEPAVADQISGEDGGKPTLGTFFGHVLPLRLGAAA
jgi:hypothetical protein